jgi:hypothetical protein
MDKYIKELWRVNAIPSSPVFAGRMTYEGFYNAIQQAMQAQREACAEALYNESNNENIDVYYKAVFNAEVKQ